MAALGPEAALIFRITHVSNVPWILDHGLHCKSSKEIDPSFVPIGMPDLIEKRSTRTVPIKPGGSLADYIPFYFTPWSVMMYNIKTGHNGVIKRPNAEIVIVVSSLHKLQEAGTAFVFTNAHAYMEEAEYFDCLADLIKVDWDLLRKRDFRRDPEDPGKLGRYQAEALAHKCVPVGAITGVACYNTETKDTLAATLKERGLRMTVRVMPDWYF